MNLPDQFREFIGKEKLFIETDRLLLAVSGGLDSVVLCECCRQAGYSFAIAHCNFQLRGEESLRDQQFVEELARHYGVPFHVKEFDTAQYGADNKVSIQVAARFLRYDWFASLLEDDRTFAGLSASSSSSVQSSPLQSPSEPIAASKQKKQPHPIAASKQKKQLLSSSKYLLTAHHLDDSIETMLMNFFKGTGIAGLRGILPKQGNIVRPLLFAGKEVLRTFGEQSGLRWVEDSSNESDKYARNYFRHHIIPSLQNIYPAVNSNLADNLRRFRDIEELYKQSVAGYKKKLIVEKGNEIQIPVLMLQKTPAAQTVLYEIIKSYGFSSAQVYEIWSLLESSSGKYVQSHSHRIFRNRHWLVISPLATETAARILVDENHKEVVYPGGKIRFTKKAYQPEALSAAASIACIDTKHLRYPLLLRAWTAGDYFYPLGMTKKKKLARFLIDQKLSKTDKEKVWVIEMDKKIIWVTGMRIDNRFRVTGSSTEILQMELVPA